MEAVETSKEMMEKVQRLPIIMSGEANKKISEKEEKHLRECVLYEFMNLEEPGLMMKFSYGNAKNKKVFTFMHGGKYRVPRFIARHVEGKSTPIWGWKTDGEGSMIKTQKGSKSRFQMREVYE